MSSASPPTGDAPPPADALALASDARTRTHRLLAVCALLFAAARFAPLPLLDDILRARIRKAMVERLLALAGGALGADHVEPLWHDASGCGAGCLSLLWKLPLKLLLFPIRKLLSIIGAAHHLARDVTEALLYGRAVKRALAVGLLPAEASPAELHARATAVRAAFDGAFLGADLAAVRGALGAALGRVPGLPRAALREVRAFAAKSRPDAEAHDATVTAGASVIEEVLGRPEVQRAVADFDARFDAAVAASPTLAATSPPS